MEKLPKKLKRPITAASIEDRTLEAMINWLRVLLKLGREHGNSVFRTYVKFLPHDAGLAAGQRFHPWEECPHLPKFDPVECLTNPDVLRSDTWREEHQQYLNKLPHVIAASLTKPILYASINAIDLLLRTGEIEVLEGRRVLRKRGDRKPSLEDADSLLSVLNAYHGVQREIHNNKRITTTQVMKDLGWLQPRVSRAFKHLFGDMAKTHRVSPMMFYRNLCKDESIVGVLGKLHESREHAKGRYTTNYKDNMIDTRPRKNEDDS